ncbi:MAG: collagen-like protein [Phycisphaerales bacterium]|nr:collagen-like protein [Phycisphaerales bacterium]
MVFLTLWLTRFFVSLGVFRKADLGVDRFEAILPSPRFGALAYNTDLWLLGITGKVSAIVISIWVYALVGLLAAFAISYFLSANTWIYLLLRRDADGTEFDEINLDKPASDAPPTSAVATGAPGYPASPGASGSPGFAGASGLPVSQAAQGKSGSPDPSDGPGVRGLPGDDPSAA